MRKKTGERGKKNKSVVPAAFECKCMSRVVFGSFFFCSPYSRAGQEDEQTAQKGHLLLPSSPPGLPLPRPNIQDYENERGPSDPPAFIAYAEREGSVAGRQAGEKVRHARGMLINKSRQEQCSRGRAGASEPPASPVPPAMFPLMLCESCGRERGREEEGER